MRTKWNVKLALAAAAALASAHAAAGTISLAWSPVAGAAGYRVYYGVTSGDYGSYVDAGTGSQATLNGLEDCTTYYIAVKAYNPAGESTGYSNEITGWSRPIVSATTPGHRQQGDEAIVEIQGANFRPGATIRINNPHLALSSATVLDCDRIQLEMAVAPAAPGLRAAEVGGVNVEVMNPDGTYGTRIYGFEVHVDPARFDVNKSDSSTRDRLDGKDTVWMARLFGSQETRDALYDPDFDLDGNGWVDGSDLAYLASNLGRCWSGSTWTVEACAAH